MGEKSFVHSAEGAYIESLYNSFLTNPESVDASWQKFFQGFDLGLQSSNGHAASNGSATPAVSSNIAKELSVASLIQAYRERGHLLSDTNPIRQRKDRKPHLALSDYGLTEADLKLSFQAGAEVGLPGATLEEIVKKLSDIYLGPIGAEFMYIDDKEERDWIMHRFEEGVLKRSISIDKSKRILKKLNEAVVFENFLHTKFVGQKRFSLEGGETTIPALDALISVAASHGVKEIVIGMAHRGRLNVLANILRKTYDYIFSEFEGITLPDTTMGDGDVKYHLGFSSEVTTPNGDKVYLKLVPNPSHLEAVNPVVQGFVRSKGDMLYGEDRQAIMPILIHGDAAIAGQGIVYEVAQMSGLEGYTVGGTIHFVINNQIGFTTDFDDARSSVYATPVAYVSESPVFHVNGDDPEAVVFCMELAAEYRQKYQKDVYVDMVCYRRHGHNEGDEPKYTQPKLYELIDNHENPREVYSDLLVKRGSIEAKLAGEMAKQFKADLQDRLNLVKQQPLSYTPQPNEKEWDALNKATPNDFITSPDTSVSLEALTKITEVLSAVPADFKPIKKANDELAKRNKSFQEDKLPWAMGELLAYGSLLMEGHHIRISGQDVIRGTFSHRHAVIFDETTNNEYCNLNHIQEQQGKFRIFNSFLSEYAVLGFEYGYTIPNPNTLTIWEAQFGDFANGAQVIIDQFLSSGETKWERMSGLVLLLPHGYEGQGPEHSSARLERFLELAADNNMIIANCTSPSNYFHLLRRQLKWSFRKPLVVFTPKSLLRHPKVVSPKEEFTQGCFQELYDDAFVTKTKVKRLLFCSGRIYFDLLERQQADNRKDVAIIRVEQLYPMPENKIEEVLDKYPKAERIWIQEEPKNMGAWTYWLRREGNQQSFRLISRKASASPATGFSKLHTAQQKALIDEAFSI